MTSTTAEDLPTQASETPSRRERWESAVEVPMLVLAVVFVVAYAWQVVDQGLSSGTERLLEYVVWGTWVAFVLDYVVRVVVSRDRATYLRRHWYEVPIVVLPMLRPLRLLQLLVFVRVINRGAAHAASRAATYIGMAAVIAVLIGALAVLDAEQDAAGANITSFGNALWWACVTVTTVGYGDLYPITVTGRLVALGLMVFGVALIGALTATVAAWLVGQVGEEREAEEEVEDDVRQAELLEELARVREELASVRSDLAARADLR